MQLQVEMVLRPARFLIHSPSLVSSASTRLKNVLSIVDNMHDMMVVRSDLSLWGSLDALRSRLNYPELSGPTWFWSPKVERCLLPFTPELRLLALVRAAVFWVSSTLFVASSNHVVTSAAYFLPLLLWCNGYSDMSWSLNSLTMWPYVSRPGGCSWSRLANWNLSKGIVRILCSKKGEACSGPCRLRGELPMMLDLQPGTRLQSQNQQSYHGKIWHQKRESQVNRTQNDRELTSYFWTWYSLYSQTVTLHRWVGVLVIFLWRR